MDEATLRKDIANAVNDWMGITLTDDQINEILNDRDLGCEARRHGIDTLVRENIGHYLARKITGRSWPLGNTPKPEAEEFFRLYETNAEAKGFMLRKG